MFGICLLKELPRLFQAGAVPPEAGPWQSCCERYAGHTAGFHPAVYGRPPYRNAGGGHAPVCAESGACSPVLYEDADVVVFDKPPGMPVHPSHRHREDTLANLFAARYGEKGVGCSFHPINRLDKDTSGLCVVAKHPVAAAALSGAVDKVYYAVAEGIVSPPEGIINLPIARAEESIILRKVDPAGQTAATRYRTLRTGNRHTLLEIRLETGRTHQIRVHFSHLGFPLAGDILYGGCMEFVRRQALHCGVVQFRQPLTEKPVLVQAPFPPDLLHILNE